MFPLNSPSIFQLVLIGVAMSSSLAVLSDWRARIAFLLLAVALPYSFLMTQLPEGEYAFLGYLIVVGPAFIAFVVGGGIASIAFWLGAAPRMAISVVLCTGLAGVSFVLWHQYVPDACKDATLQVRISGETLHLPAEMQPRLDWGEEAGIFGNFDRKVDFAKFCRMSRNGARPIDIDAIRINLNKIQESMIDSCRAGRSDDWCQLYTSDLNRQGLRLNIAPESQLPFLSYYWEEESSIEKVRKGDLQEGWVCHLNADNHARQCWSWQPFGDGARMTLSWDSFVRVTDNASAPVDVALATLRAARQRVLNQISTGER